MLSPAYGCKNYNTIAGELLQQTKILEDITKDTDNLNKIYKLLCKELKPETEVCRFVAYLAWFSLTYSHEAILLAVYTYLA